MAGTNTEKPTGKQEKMKQQAVNNTNQSKKETQNQSQQKKTQEKKTEENQNKTTKETEEKKQAQEQKTEEKAQTSEKSGDKKQASEEQKKKQSRPKKSEAKVNVRDLPISTKVSAAICRFIKNKEIKKAMNELDSVIEKKIAVPMKGEYPHRKGMMSGKYPVKAAQHFRSLLKGLSANAIENGLEKPMITTAIANIGQRPMAKFGMWQKKRTHLTIIAKESSGKVKKTNKNKQNKK